MHLSWRQYLETEFKKEYMTKIHEFINLEISEGKKIYPPKEKIFNAFNMDINNVKVVIFGQDPYYREGQANGLAFSVDSSVKVPASLQNIYKEISNEFNIDMNMKNGDLTPWMEQGVLLLNTILTVEDGKPNSHKNLGWSTFTDSVIRCINNINKPIVFMLWGANAKAKKELLTNRKHLILESVHPSPLSAYNGFFGTNHFQMANQFLSKNGVAPINWQI